MTLRRAALLALALGASGRLAAERNTAPSPFDEPPWPVPRHTERADHQLPWDIEVPAYQRVLARHLYEAYPGRVLRGRLPPMMHAVMFTEALLAADGQIVTLQVLREPAHSPEVAPWLRTLIRRAAPYPVPAGVGTATGTGTLWWREVWLVDRSARLQAMSLSQGQGLR